MICFFLIILQPSVISSLINYKHTFFKHFLYFNYLIEENFHLKQDDYNININFPGSYSGWTLHYEATVKCYPDAVHRSAHLCARGAKNLVEACSESLCKADLLQE